jgi:hypothetical protein
MIDDIAHYFEETVLPSVGIPKKGTYNLTEVSIILGVHRNTVRRYHKQGKIKISPAGKVYYKELIDFFVTDSAT